VHLFEKSTELPYNQIKNMEGSKMDIKEIFSENLSHFINKSGRKAVDIAAEIGVSKGTFSDWRNGKSLPRTDKFDDLCAYFSCSRADLLEQRSEENEYYLNKEVQEIAEELYNDSTKRALFSASRNLSKEDILIVKDLIERLTK
jgi:transcriptional regulator with XRE-family HTH domain